ncbi:MAG: HNH endonuclease signature motif containing protein, partial [Acidobacteria bacterium]|nr:HNH endonuclease signature motif containing protein [Acidobacteriota bacterium]
SSSHLTWQLSETHFRHGLLGVDPELAWRDWPSRLLRIKSVRLADDVVAEYRLRGKSYEVAAEAGLDVESGVFWVKRNRQGSRALYRALAAQLVFKPAARPLDLTALELVLDAEVDDPSYGRPARVSRSAEGGVETEGATEDDEREDDDSEVGEAMSGHAPFKPDPARNVPSPGPIPESAGAGPSVKEKERAGGAAKSEGGGAGAATPRLEKLQVSDLKINQYAFHCQMCLCVRSPHELAPAGSYIESAEVRQRVIEAHHVDLRSARGARHAGNLILLCRLHHHNYGRRLTRAAVLGALKRPHETRTLCFVGPPDTKKITGEVVEIEITGKDGDKVKLFFTEPHASFWRSFEPSDA